ncbi:hypothetical protein BC938DRAFT_476886 [Jimgerdemannia flammicorona]|uniref:Uncharacterized protein n=1 Tax=Jimgerdemannia flammicorona TaxID=994334 RepID=A0A433QQ03_9FUNG|nr:hypothetical protein BC938DRAFT_476886 [Jimgerdemannia flammicorona]
MGQKSANRGFRAKLQFSSRRKLMAWYLKAMFYNFTQTKFYFSFIFSLLLSTQHSSSRTHNALFRDGVPDALDEPFSIVDLEVPAGAGVELLDIRSEPFLGGCVGGHAPFGDLLAGGAVANAPRVVVRVRHEFHELVRNHVDGRVQGGVAVGGDIAVELGDAAGGGWSVG